MTARGLAQAPCYATQALRLVALTELNRNMLGAAESQQWDDLAKLEQQRAGLLEELFCNSFYALDDAALIPVLTQTFAINQRITVMLEGAQRSCQDEFAEISLGRRATQAYGQGRD